MTRTASGRQRILDEAGAVGVGLWLPAVLWLFMVAVVILSGWEVRRFWIRTRMDIIRSELATAADLRLKEVERWLAEREADARLFADNGRSISLELMASWRVHAHLEGLAVLDPSGAMVRSVGELGPSGHYLPHLAEAVRAERPVHLLNVLPGDAKSDLDMLLALPSTGPEPGGRGFVLLRVDPERDLFRHITEWPTTHRTAETVIVMRDRDDALFLHCSRGPAAARFLRRPLSAGGLPAVKAIHGELGFMAATDYRGRPVYAVTRQVGDLPLFVVTKVEQEEIQGPLTRMSQGITLVGLGLVSLGSLVFAAWWWLFLRRRKQELEQLQTRKAELEVRLDHLSRQANDIIWLLDEGGRFLDVNERACELYGYTRDELLGMSVEGIRTSDNRDQLQEQMRRLLEQGSLRFETVHRRKDGTEFPVETSARVIELGGKRCIQSVMRDITERKQVEHALLSSEARYRLLFETLQEGFALHEIMLDEHDAPVDYRFLELNPAFEALTGLRRVDLIGHRVREVLPGIEEVWIQRYGRVALTGEIDHFEDHAKALGKWFEVHAFSPQHGQFAVLVADITSRKEAEARLQHLLEDLEHRAHELRASNDELSRFNRAATGRELRMIELKREVNTLCERCGLPPRFGLEFIEAAPRPAEEDSR